MLDSGNFKAKKDMTKTNNELTKYSVMSKEERDHMIVPPKFSK